MLRSRTVMLGAVMISDACVHTKNTTYLRIGRPLPMSLQARDLLDLTRQIISRVTLARILIVPCPPHTTRSALLLLLCRHASLPYTSALGVSPPHFSLCESRRQ